MKLLSSVIPPFIQVPSHVDGEHVFEAALSLEAKLYRALPDIDEALMEYEKERRPGYWKEWFRRKSGNYLSYIQMYAYIISMAVPKYKPEMSKIRLLDYGAGWGLMSFLAKEIGISHVSYLENDQESMGAATIIGEVLGLSADEYISGGEKSLQQGSPNRFDSVVSSDVLEHIYDVDSVFQAMAWACSPGAVSFHQTGANPSSPIIRRKLMNLHRSVETQDPKELERMHELGEKAIWEDRRDFIEAYAPEVNAAELRDLAIASRGLNTSRLELAIDTFRENKQLPIPEHPTNTCYLHGYWLERLMDPASVAQKLSNCGFETRIAKTFWGPGRSTFIKRIAKHGLNLVTRVSTSLGMRVSFYYGIHGVKPE